MSFSSEKSMYQAIDSAMQKSQEGKTEESIKLFEKILPSVQKDQYPNISARIEFELGEEYCNLPGGNDPDRNLDIAAQHYIAALSYYSPDNDPYAVILITEKLGRINKYLYDKSKEPERLQSAIQHYGKALSTLRNSIPIFSTLKDYKTSTTSELKKEDYLYRHAAIQLNFTFALKAKADMEGNAGSDEKAEIEYLSSLKMAIGLFNHVVDTHDLHHADYLNGWHNLGNCYSLLSEKYDERANLDYAVNAYENGLKYFFSKKSFKEMYPQYFELVVNKIQAVKQKTGEPFDAQEYKNYENARQTTDDDDICRNCGSADIIKGYTIPLCEKCRKAFIRFRAPLPIKLFSALILAVFLLAMFRFPTALGVGIDFERGMKADKELKCQTALKYLVNAQKAYPDSMLINGRVFIDLAKCSKYSEASELFNEKIANRDIDDNALYQDINEMYQKVFMPNDNYQELMSIYNSGTPDTLEEMIPQMEAYNRKYPQNVEGLAYLGQVLFTLGRFEEARELELKALSLQPNRDDIRLALAGTYRQTGELDKSMKECRYILENINSENAIAIGSISRLYLKKRQFPEALKYANQAMTIDGEAEYNLETIALAYHFNNMIKERDSAVEKIESIQYDEKVKQSDLQFLKEVFEGKSKLYH